jgi:hypothetical protein
MKSWSFENHVLGACLTSELRHLNVGSWADIVAKRFLMLE